MSTPEEVCAGSVGEQEGYHFTGILQKTNGQHRCCEKTSCFSVVSSVVVCLGVSVCMYSAY